ncbi:MAG TPA: Na+/H+ antiporter NhaA [Kofleriaceae bacterium]|nr:Na+/H+ antiporter NhaA [Kofleriaceae bacterium]
MSRSSLPPDAWSPAHKAAKRLTAPIYRFFALETASGLLLMAAVALALGWANSPWASYYDAIWHTKVSFSIGSWATDKDLHFWVNDGLMTIFFFVVGLEIRREIFEGELASLRQAALPLAAAVGGMVVPAAIFVAFNAGRATSGGWAIPMATDIAFAVGVLTVLGSRVPVAWRVLLLALAVIDDIGAIVVIAAFYSTGIAGEGLVIALAGVLGVMILQWSGVRTPLVYVVPGAVVWAGMLASGIHPTLAGVMLGLLTPVRPWFGPSGFAATTQAHLEDLPAGDRHALITRLDQINQARVEAVSPVERRIHELHPYVAFGIMPLFALANAGVVLGGADISGDALWLFVGIVAGLAVGKPLGIVAVSIGTSRLGIATRSAEMTGRGLLLVGMVGGIGFTMSLFIAQLAFPPGPYLDTAKLAILVGSGVAMFTGLFVGLAMGRRPPAPLEVTSAAGDPAP